MDLKPLSFKENNEMKGYEIDLLYRFAKEKNYNINLGQANIIEKINYLQEDKVLILLEDGSQLLMIGNNQLIFQTLFMKEKQLLLLELILKKIL